MSLKTLAFFLALTCVLAGAPVAQAATPQTTAADHAIDYVRGLQNGDGGFPDFGTDSTVSATLDAVIAFEDAGVDVDAVQRSGKSPIDFLETQAADYAAATPGQAAKLVAVLVIIGEDPHHFAGQDFVATMQSKYDAAAHRYGEQTLDQALYILAQRSLGHAISEADVSVLRGDELPAGCWEFAVGFGCDTNSTAIAIQALIAAGVSPADASIRSALDYFAASQNADGGFPYVAPGESDANSTAVVVQALTVAGEDVDASGRWEKPNGRTPVQALLGLQDGATGAFTYAGEDNAYATYQAVPALLLQPILLPPVRMAPITPVAMPTTSPLPTVTPVPTATVRPLALASTGEGRGGDGGGLPIAVFLLTLGGIVGGVGGLTMRRKVSQE